MNQEEFGDQPLLDVNGLLSLDYNGQPQDGSKAKEEEIVSFVTKSS
jgi:hypothetical protein